MYILRIVNLRHVLPWAIINKGATRQLRRDSLRYSNVAAVPRIIFLRRSQYLLKTLIIGNVYKKEDKQVSLPLNDIDIAQKNNILNRHDQMTQMH